MKQTLKIFTTLLLLNITFSNSYSQQNTSGWYWINSQPQGNEIRWVQIIDATHYYAVGKKGTFMKSTDAGDTWLINSQAGNPEPFFGSGGTLNLSTGWFFDANTGFVGGSNSDSTGNSYIQRTTDGGETFTRIPLNNGYGNALIRDIYFLNANTGYICGSQSLKLMKTTNGGLNWTNVPNLPVDPFSFKSIYALDENNVFLGTDINGSNGKILRTTDGAATWSIDILPGTTGLVVNDIVFKDNNTGYIASSNSYFAFTTNAGVSWTQAVFPISSQQLYEIKITGSNVNVLGSYQAYYSTSNSGVTWDSVRFNDPSNLNQPYTSVAYSFDIKGLDQIVVGLNGKVNISNDGGTTWRNKNYSVGNNDDTYPAIFALPGTSDVWAGSEFTGKVLHSTNSGANWTIQQTSMNTIINDLIMVTPQVGYFTGGNAFNGQGGKTYRTIDGGANWVQLNLPNSFQPLFDIDFVDINTGWVFGGLYQGGAIISKTTNAGVTWISQSTTPSSINVIATGDMSDASNGYCISAFDLFKTTNGGVVWNKVTTTPTNLFGNSIKTFSADIVYVGSDREIFKSTDGGATWTQKNIPSGKLRGMDWSDENNGTVVGVDGFTAKTNDGGDTWTLRNTGTSTIKGVSMISKDTVYASCNLNDYGALFRLVDTDNAMTLNLTIGIQGFWNGSTQISDTIDIHLMNSVSPFNEIESVTGVLNTSGQGTFIFNSAPSGNYYIKITHRNSLETWNASPVALSTGGSLNYNFTTAAAQAYGNNIILTSGRYCNYSGDVTQEGSVDLNDVVDVNNASSVFTAGYVIQDVTGDDLVDLSDLIITFNNASLFVAKITP
jgi:photosystem II stability/assembly factor-like uncharacterized protein